jgi:hypothetical protein
MIKLSVESLKGGEVLAQDVVRADGVILMTAGRAITEDSMSLLRRLEVKSVVVEGDQFASEEERMAHVQAQERALDERFSRVQEDQVLMAVREIFRQRLRQGCWLEGGPKTAGANTEQGTAEPGEGREQP